MMWEMWSPAGWFDEAMFQSVSRSFLNPDWVDVTLNSYRSRWGEDSLDRRGKALEDKVATTKSIDTPAVFFHGAEDGVVPLAMSADMHKKFSGPFERVVLPGAGHFLTRERPEAIGKRIAALFSSRATNKNLSAMENNR